MHGRFWVWHVPSNTHLHLNQTTCSFGGLYDGCYILYGHTSPLAKQWGFWRKTAWSITCLDSRETPRRDPSQSQKAKGFGGDTWQTSLLEVNGQKICGHPKTGIPTSLQSDPWSGDLFKNSSKLSQEIWDLVSSMDMTFHFGSVSGFMRAKMGCDLIRGGVGGVGGGASPFVHLRSGQHLTKGAMQTVRWGSYDVPWSVGGIGRLKNSPPSVYIVIIDEPPTKGCRYIYIYDMYICIYRYLYIYVRFCNAKK